MLVCSRYNSERFHYCTDGTDCKFELELAVPWGDSRIRSYTEQYHDGGMRYNNQNPVIANLKPYALFAVKSWRVPLEYRTACSMWVLAEGSNPSYLGLPSLTVKCISAPNLDSYSSQNCLALMVTGNDLS